ncbi:MAG: hypothetical protein HY590_07355 [Candidatus Omnitrophica bacterium]|nr:hypothetical protein [Candidatus Omnitrophota bacterium]
MILKMNNRGIVLIYVYMVVFVLLVLMSAYLSQTNNEARLSERTRHSTEAFYIAEGALQQAMLDLRQDMIASEDWFDGDIDGIAMAINASSFTPIPYGSNTMGDGTFLVELKGITGKNSYMWVRATGTSSGITRRVQAYLQAKNLSPWDNAIFAADGTADPSENPINGNVDVRGSVHILGNPLDPNRDAMEMGGGAKIGNNYAGISPMLSLRIPPLDPQDFNGDMVETLNAEVRVKHGKLSISGTASVGEPNVTGDSFKETLDGVYITDGYSGNKGASSVFSDNGTATPYDAGDLVQFKTFDDPYGSYPSYRAFVLAEGTNLGAGNFDNTRPDFTIPGKFKWEWQGNTGTITIIDPGVFYVNGTDIEIGKKNSTVFYEGRATLVALGGDLNVHSDLYTVGTFPLDDVVAFLAEEEIEIGHESQLKVIGAFYAEETIEVAKQSSIAGTLFADSVSLGAQVPNVYQVPELIRNLPPGLIAPERLIIIKVKSWQEVS